MKRILLTLLILSVITQAKEFKIITYNIYGGRQANGNELGELLKKYDPDFISLQEVDKDTKRSNFKDITKDMAEQLGYEYYHFQKAMNYDSGEYGIAIISRYPISKILTSELPSTGKEKRQVIITELDEKIFNRKVTVVNTHIDYNDVIKREQLNTLLNLTNKIDDDIVFLSGDLNILPDTANYMNIREDWKDTYTDVKVKNRDELDSRIDYIFGNDSKYWKTKKSLFLDDGINWSKYSDHVPYMAILNIK